MNGRRRKAEAYLRRIQSERKKAGDLNDKVVRLREIAQSARGVMSGDGSGQSSDGLGRSIAKLVDTENEYKAALAKYINDECEAGKLLHQLRPEYGRLLRLRFFEDATWADVASLMHYSERWVYYAYDHALDDLYALLKDRGLV